VICFGCDLMSYGLIFLGLWICLLWFSLCIRSLEFVMLKALGRGATWLNFFVNSWASLYAGALRHFTTGRIGWSCLCSFIRPLMLGAEGFI
jgi:hypothetical protein